MDPRVAREDEPSRLRIDRGNFVAAPRTQLESMHKSMGHEIWHQTHRAYRYRDENSLSTYTFAFNEISKMVIPV